MTRRPSRSAKRSLGTSSRLRPGSGRRRVWKSPSGVEVWLPVVLDLVHVDPITKRTIWAVEAKIDRVGGEPRLVEVVVRGRDGLDPVFLQRFFRWSTPLDVVRRTVPELLAAGADPYRHAYATDGYPDAANLRRRLQNARSDGFLEEVAREYLAIGRGYARAIASNRAVSPRTVVSWVEKARRRGILSKVRPGQFGGRIVPREQRRPSG